MSKEYDKYLTKHKCNVCRAFYWIQDNVPELLKGDYEKQITIDHDMSKYGTEEYDAYDTYFYGDNKSYEAKQEINKAWLHHIHVNPHHWQYYILINDDPNEGEIILDMPYNYIIEMICDLWSFGWSKYDLTEIFKWYHEHKKYIKLSEKTRDTVEYILQEIGKKLH